MQFDFGRKARRERELEGCRSAFLDTLRVSCLSISFGLSAAARMGLSNIRRQFHGNVKRGTGGMRKGRKSLNGLVTKGLIWAENTARMSSTGKIYSSGTRYGQALIDALHDGASTLEAAHHSAAHVLKRSKTELTAEEAQELREMGIQAHAGRCTERAAIKSGLEYHGIARGTRTSVLILVGPEYSDEEETIGFDREALRLRNAFERAFDAQVMIARASSAKAVHNAIKTFAEVGSGGQGIVFFTGHGGFDTGENGTGSWANQSDGEFLCGKENSSALFLHFTNRLIRCSQAYRETEGRT